MARVKCESCNGSGIDIGTLGRDIVEIACPNCSGGYIDDSPAIDLPSSGVSTSGSGLWVVGVLAFFISVYLILGTERFVAVILFGAVIYLPFVRNNIGKILRFSMFCFVVWFFFVVIIPLYHQYF